MRSESRHPSAKEYVRDLAASGRYDLASRELQSALGVSAAAKLALNRLAKKNVIASPARGKAIRSLFCDDAGFSIYRRASDGAPELLNAKVEGGRTALWRAGGTGRRRRLKIVRPQGHGGSSPSPATIYFDSTVSHGYRRIGAKRTTALVVLL